MAASPAPAPARPRQSQGPTFEAPRRQPAQPAQRPQPAGPSKLGILVAAFLIMVSGVYFVSKGPGTSSLFTSSSTTNPAAQPSLGGVSGLAARAKSAAGGLLGRPRANTAPSGHKATNGQQTQPGSSGNPAPQPSSQSSTTTGGGGQSGGSSSAGSCTVTPKLVPTCAGALYGLYIPPKNSWVQDINNIEQSIGRRLTIVKRYHDFSGTGSAGAFPTADELKLMSEGNILHFAWTSKMWNGTSSPGWAAIAAGKEDSMLHAEAQRLAAVNTPFFIDFDHEMDGKSRASFGTPADYVAAYRHIHALFAADGVTKAIWAWVPTGYSGNWSKLAALYPGNDVVDWIGYDPYNWSTTNWQGPLPVMKPFYDWLNHGGLGAAAAAKPRMLGEYGSIADPNNPQRRADWMRQVPAALAALPDLRAIEYWSDGQAALGSGDMPGFASAGQSSYAQLR